MKEKVLEKIIENSLAMEIVLYILSLIGYLLMRFKISTGGILITLSLSLLALIYFLRGYNENYHVEADPYTRFIGKLLNWGFAISMVGILFALMNYAGAIAMLRVSFFTILICVPFTGYFLMKNKMSELKYQIIRWILIGGLTLIFYINPTILN